MWDIVYFCIFINIIFQFLYIFYVRSRGLVTSLGNSSFTAFFGCIKLSFWYCFCAENNILKLLSHQLLLVMNILISIYLFILPLSNLERRHTANWNSTYYKITYKLKFKTVIIQNKCNFLTRYFVYILLASTYKLLQLARKILI